MLESVEDCLAARRFRLHTLEGSLGLLDGNLDLVISLFFSDQTHCTVLLMSYFFNCLSLGDDSLALEEAVHIIVSIELTITIVLDFFRAASAGEECLDLGIFL